MRREPTFKSDDTVIWATCLLLAALLGGLAAYAVVVAVGSAPDLLFASLREVVGLIAAGVLLIVLALQGRLVRAFLISFAAVFLVTLAVATHGFTAL